MGAFAPLGEGCCWGKIVSFMSGSSLCSVLVPSPAMDLLYHTIRIAFFGMSIVYLMKYFYSMAIFSLFRQNSLVFVCFFIFLFFVLVGKMRKIWFFWGYFVKCFSFAIRDFLLFSCACLHNLYLLPFFKIFAIIEGGTWYYI